jgi:hypothetical protein
MRWHTRCLGSIQAALLTPTTWSSLLPAGLLPSHGEIARAGTRDAPDRSRRRCQHPRPMTPVSGTLLCSAAASRRPWVLPENRGITIKWHADIIEYLSEIRISPIAVARRGRRRSGGFQEDIRVPRRAVQGCCRPPHMEAYFHFDWSNVYYSGSIVPSC